MDVRLFSSTVIKRLRSCCTVMDMLGNVQSSNKVYDTDSVNDRHTLCLGRPLAETMTVVFEGC